MRRQIGKAWAAARGNAKGPGCAEQDEDDDGRADVLRTPQPLAVGAVPRVHAAAAVRVGCPQRVERDRRAAVEGGGRVSRRVRGRGRRVHDTDLVFHRQFFVVLRHRASPQRHRTAALACVRRRGLVEGRPQPCGPAFHSESKTSNQQNPSTYLWRGRHPRDPAGPRVRSRPARAAHGNDDDDAGSARRHRPRHRSGSTTPGP